MRGLLVLLMCTVGLPLWAQTSSNLTCAWTSGNELVLEGHVDPASISISDPKVLLQFDQVTKKLVLENMMDSVQVCWRVLVVTDTTYVKKEMTLYDSTARFKEYSLVTSQPREQLFETGDVNTSGRLSRGFTMGTNQDVFVNSALNLTMDGKLAENLNIQATITDQQVPFQPEGNTAQLQDLDRVFIKLYNDRVSLTAGDIVLKNSSSHFLKYYKNVKGASFLRNTPSAGTHLGASVAKGKFATVAVSAREGIQGPYRIPGPEGQDFVVVLANSERIYVDGKQLRRGFDLDYTIDYNMGEIVFTPHVIITRFSRIRVDYEYAENNYSRFVVAAGHHQTVGKVRLGVSAYSERDNKNSPNFDLTSDGKQKLSEAGDDPLKAIVPSSDSVAFEPNKILYKKVIVAGEEIFVYSTNPDSAYWEVSFNRVGNNQGNYQQKISSVNGRLYEYAAPINGVMQGEYVPYKILPAPSKKQMVEVSAKLQVNEYETISAEVAFSDHDQNQYSKIDDANNSGQAIQFMAKSEGRSIGKGWEALSFGGLEYLGANFRAIDRFRDVEFDRDWSYFIHADKPLTSDLVIRVGGGIEKNATNKITYEVAKRNKEYAVDGYQNRLVANKDIGRFRLMSDFFTSNNHVLDQSAYWKKLRTDLSYQLGAYRLGYAYENVAQENMQEDSVTYSTNFYKQHMAYFRSDNSEKEFLDVSFRFRDNSQPFEGEMIESSYSNTFNATYRRRFSPNQDVGITFNYRDIKNKGNIDFGSGTSVTSQLEWFGAFLNKTIKNDLTWSVSNGRDLKKEYVFVEVATGRGNYTWIDYNEDGVRDLNEFNLAANVDERNFAKIFIPTSEYIDAYENTFNYKFYLLFPRAWRKAGGFKYILSKLSNTTTWTSLSRTTDPSLQTRLFGFAQKVDRDNVLSKRENLRTTWFFNRGNPRYGLTGGYHQTRFLNLLTSGFEDKSVNESNITGRLNLGTYYSLQVVSKMGKELSSSDFLNDRNFTISTNTIKPTFTWQPKPTFRVNTGVGRIGRSNNESVENMEKAMIHEVFAECKISKMNKLSLQANLVLSQVAFEGNQNSPVGYALLNGLQPGTNVNWSVIWQQTLINGLQLSVFYNGRKGELINTIHSGSVSMSALF